MQNRKHYQKIQSTNVLEVYVDLSEVYSNIQLTFYGFYNAMNLYLCFTLSMLVDAFNRWKY